LSRAFNRATKSADVVTAVKIRRILAPSRGKKFLRPAPVLCSVGMANRLANETSPYLLQHANNPVDWFAWGKEAFAKARRENKPIFLSIGYSTCHWCHVMERESFEDEDVAAVMNRHFVCIKVDREERPDIDKIYMTATQATTGGGGWPMSVWLTPDLKPFYCGTYFPARNFVALLERIHEVWEVNHAGILDQAKRLTDALKQYTTMTGGDGNLDDSPLKLGLEQFRQMYDAEHGGFGGAPKFPRPVALNFLFRAGGADMALHTLRKMGEGGLFDHLGGGFHRYSVDDRWLVSHFEKMLYDQAQLVCSYVDAYQLTRDEFFADIARRTCDYVLRDMTAPDGGFYSAEDADSEGVEGKFYVWTRAEVEKIAGEEFCRAYDVTKPGNWEHGLNALHGTGFPEERAKLFAVRNRRVRPHRDEKIITAWNGLMISALARAAQALDEPRYCAAAQKAARRYGKMVRSGNVPAMLDDYAFLATGLVDLYETDFDPAWLEKSIELTDEVRQKFYDREHGGFFMTTGDDPSVILRVKEEYDGAEPSGNSVATLLLLRLAQFNDRPDYRQAAEKTLGLFSVRMRSAPRVMPQMLCALDFSLTQPKQIVLTDPDAAMLRVIRQRFLPNKIVKLEERPRLDGKPTAYVCADFACRRPTNEAGQLLKLLE
jgi:uncharacterized protein YyaL (SSP411 family)